MGPNINGSRPQWLCDPPDLPLPPSLVQPILYYHYLSSYIYTNILQLPSTARLQSYFVWIRFWNGRKKGRMAMSSSCCLNMRPPLPDPPSIPPPTMRYPLSRPEERKEKPWKRRNNKLVVGVACAVIGLEMAIAPMTAMEAHQRFISSNETLPLVSAMEPAVQSKGGRWSDRRSCPPWNLNLYETIVPENLPRPSAHRRWEAVAYGDSNNQHPVAPPLKKITITRTKPGCFSM